MPTLEADDAMGIYATSNDDCIIVSPDKDMKQIPGTLYNLKVIKCTWSVSYTHLRAHET